MTPSHCLSSPIHVVMVSIIIFIITTFIITKLAVVIVVAITKLVFDHFISYFIVVIELSLATL